MNRSLAGIGNHPFTSRLLAVAVLLAGLVSPITAADLPERKFEVGLARSCIPNVNHNDAVAAYRMLLMNIGRRQGHRMQPEVTIYEDTAHLAAAVGRGTMHLVAMDAWQFLALEGLREIRPYFVPAVNGQVGRRYVVLARRGSAVRTVADLRGRAVVQLDSVNNDICRNWLETLLPADPAHPATELFAALENVAKPTAAVLPVFFGQRAACIVDEGSFNLMKELNPQVGNALEAIAVSDRYVSIIICLGEANWISPEAKADAVRVLSDLGSDSAGRQVLSLFKITGLVAFQNEHLANVRELQRKVKALSSRLSLAPAGPRPLPPPVPGSTVFRGDLIGPVAAERRSS